MSNHPNRSGMSKPTRVVTYKITPGGELTRCQEGTTSDLAIRVTGVPQDVRDAAVMVQLHKVILLPTAGPWLVRWDALAAAVQGAILRDCK